MTYFDTVLEKLAESRERTGYGPLAFAVGTGLGGAGAAYLDRAARGNARSGIQPIKSKIREAKTVLSGLRGLKAEGVPGKVENEITAAKKTLRSSRGALLKQYLKAYGKTAGGAAAGGLAAWGLYKALSKKK